MLQSTSNHKYRDVLHDAVKNGLLKSPKTLPSKLLFDERGSQLFDRLCETQDYYITQTELSIMYEHINEIVSLLGEQVMLIEYGSGNSLKTRSLLTNLPNLVAYVPIDISEEHLMHSAAKLASEYPELEILPVYADYDTPFDLPVPTRPVARRVAYYSGATIGQFEPHQAIDFLRQIRGFCGSDGALLIGVDLKKDTNILHRAYNVPGGYTDEFILNVLPHANHRLGADFKADQFVHEAIYNEDRGRIETYLISRQQQKACLNGDEFTFEAGERILIAYAHKYTLEEFQQVADQAGWQAERVWMDDRELFSVQYFTAKK